MKVIIPAAGVGSRLRPHTHTLPKSLLHVAGKPILGHILDTIAKLEPEEIIIITGFMGNKVQEYANEHFDLNIRYVKQDSLLGLGYAVRLGLEWVDSSDVLIILGDTIVETDLKKFTSSSDSVLGVMPVADPARFGIAEVTDNVITNLIEKPADPKSNLALIGLYYIKESEQLKSQIDRLMETGQKTKGEIQLTDALQGMISDGTRFQAIAVDGWLDCGKRETLLATNSHLLKGNSIPEPRDGVIIIPPVFIAPSAIIEESIIGPNVSISDKAIIKSSILKNSIIGFEAEVRNALLSDSVIGHKAIVTGDFRALNVGDSSEVGHF